jgi:biopolymer transport protein ExbD
VKLRRTAAPIPGVLYLAPGIQLALVLIVFLLISSSFLLQPGVAVNLPKSPFILSPQRNPRVIAITPPPLSAIYFENQQVSEAELRTRLSSLKGRTQTIVIKADKRAFYDQISAVMNIALELGFPVVLASTEQTPGL